MPVYSVIVVWASGETSTIVLCVAHLVSALMSAKFVDAERVTHTLCQLCAEEIP